ncbi:MAG: LacI family DNA-binding transcriptional regulator [Anaerolineae bacterium]
MPVTIKDIARAAGVSHTTVSRALRKHPAISAETTSRIQKLAQEMSYTPSAVAQSLAARRTRTIGMVVTTISDPFISRVVEGVERVAQDAGYSVFLSSSHNTPQRELAVVETFHRRRVDTIIVTASRVGNLYSARLDKLHIPIVLINNQEEGKYLYSVAVDDEQGARLAAAHLLELGHRRIAYVAAAHRPKSNRRRLAGYRSALAQAGLSPDPALVFASDTESDLQQGEQALDALLAQGATAVFCYNDMIAIGLLMACRRRGIAVPRRLSVAGFDDIEMARYVSPPLTTVRQPRRRLGQLAMEMALGLLNQKSVTNRRLACALIVRESTARGA